MYLYQLLKSRFFIFFWGLALFTLCGGVPISFAQVELSPAAIDFGSMPVGSRTVSDSIIIVNSGSVDILVDSLGFAGNHAVDFFYTLSNKRFPYRVIPDREKPFVFKILCEPLIVGTGIDTLYIYISGCEQSLLKIPLYCDVTSSFNRITNLNRWHSSGLEGRDCEIFAWRGDSTALFVPALKNKGFFQSNDFGQSWHYVAITFPDSV